MNRGFLRLSAAMALGLAAATTACAPVQTYNGFRSDRNNEEIPDPQVGVDTRDTVMQRFGSPSTTAVFDQTAWYYVSSVEERIAFYEPRTIDRRVMVVRFDGDTVSAVEKFGMERGRLIAYNDETTPTRGRELGVIEQLLGNVGRAPPIPDQERGGRPGRN
ncbi:outer membrane protein assembly factor BamE [Terricaulis sp.]|jgi:outer membrane protein assembly factor BamE (lipoprotein component of BamABCDE complex)|uniref:outer membrane protein assembly factor BamE n=1 Tax=Terricaulis sp. TaxID=2768686 RepID=UPI000B18970F|nr:outer membrane protein assembly factor BamE [Terricaulis sp.]MDZ4691840.1 outer membrane protein assembly factor BamE [Terricaulis sp.]